MMTTKKKYCALSGSYFCGTGGCTILLLNHEGNLIIKFSVADYPIRVANSKTKGWKDIILMSGGKNHLLQFNGKIYPSIPSILSLVITFKQL